MPLKSTWSSVVGGLVLRLTALLGVPSLLGVRLYQSILTLFCNVGLLFVGVGVGAGEVPGVAELEGYHPLALHESIRDQGGECYLVCEYQVEIHPHGIDTLAAGGEMELHVKALVIDVHGDANLSRGDKVEYVQYWGNAKDSAAEAARRTGNLAFIFRQKTPGGMFFDPQDPSSRVNYSKKAGEGLVRFFRAKKKRGG